MAQAHAAAAEKEINWEAMNLFYGDGAFDPETTRAALASVGAPVLVLAGAYDGGPTPARAAELAELFSQGDLVVQPRAGHFPWVDDPGAFVRTVAAFLDPDVRTVAVNGIRLAYRVRGEEHAPPVVLAHGRGGSSLDWAEIAEQLATTHRVYTLDLRGHGLSDWPGGYTFELLRDDLRGFIETLDLAGATVIGHSMGGGAACLLAQESHALVGRLVLEEAPPLLPADPPRPVLERPQEPPAFDWDVVLDLDVQLNGPDPAWREGLDRIQAPTLVVGGGPTSHIAQDELVRMAERIPDCRLATLDTGHLVHATDPDGFVALLREFGV